jgi:hypothetical protein
VRSPKIGSLHFPCRISCEGGFDLLVEVNVVKLSLLQFHYFGDDSVAFVNVWHLELKSYIHTIIYPNKTDGDE